MRAPLHAAGQGWHVNVERGRLVYQDDRGLMDLPAPRLFGRHQFDNAGLAIATLRAQDAFRIGPAAFEAGIVNAEWPARMQRLASGALLAQAPQGCEVWLDGGHNAEGGRVAAAALGDLEERVLASAGRHRRHDGQQGCRCVSRQFRRPDPPHHRGADSGQRQRHAAGPAGGRRRARSACAWKPLPASKRRCAALARLAYEVPPRILITGSLYLAGHVLAANGTPPGWEMRFAAIADVHGNHLALEAVIADIRAQGVEAIVNLGDMAQRAAARRGGSSRHKTKRPAIRRPFH